MKLDGQLARMDALWEGVQEERARQYFRYLIDRGGLERYDNDPFWRTPERDARIKHELAVIEEAGYSSTFVMLADVLAYCRAEKIPYGPGRGSVGGCYTAFLAGIHDADSLEWDLLFERFLNPARVSLPDIDIDVSQRHRQKVIQYIVDTYNKDDQIVLQVGAFTRAGGRAVVDLLAVAMAPTDPNAYATATNLKKCFPPTGSITGGVKIQRELHAWLYGVDGKSVGHGDKDQFIEIAEQAGWLDYMLKLDGMFTHLSKHAGGVVILRKEDVPFIPKVEVTDTKGKRNTVTGYDMYALDDLGYPKWDWLGLRTLDVVSDAHKFEGGSGEQRDLIKLWREHRDDPEPYEILQNADTVGIFQMETDGYRRVLRDFQPTCFDHIVALVALYRPGAIDYRREDGKNMVEVFIDRRHGREPVRYDHPALKPILEETYGVILYQEQQMAIVRELAGFSLAQADILRKAIGKKRPEEMAKLVPLWQEGIQRRIDDPNDPMTQAIADRIWENIEAAARYSWNKSHAVEYGLITWWTVWFKHLRRGLYCAEINSREDKKEIQANVISEARQHVEFSPPDVNIAEDRFTVAQGKIVFGLNGIKGMGDAYRSAILMERMFGGPFSSFTDFCMRLPSLPMNMKLALIKCGAFDNLANRMELLALIPKHGKDPDKKWTVAEHLNHNRKLKKPRDLPSVLEYEFPSDQDILKGELETMGYYTSGTPLKKVTAALARHSSNVIGGEIEKVTVKTDKNGNEYGVIFIVTPALQKQRVLIFASNWPTYEDRCVVGSQLLFRGRTDGNAFLAEAAWDLDDYRHHKKIKLTKGGETRSEPFDGEASTIELLEASGYTVRLL